MFVHGYGMWVCIISVHIWRCLCLTEVRNAHRTFKLLVYCYIYCYANKMMWAIIHKISETKTVTYACSLPASCWLRAVGFAVFLGLFFSLPFGSLSSHALSVGCRLFLPNQVRFSSRPFLLLYFLLPFGFFFVLETASLMFVLNGVIFLFCNSDCVAH